MSLCLTMVIQLVYLWIPSEAGLSVPVFQKTEGDYPDSPFWDAILRESNSSRKD
jgi:hypothetical protein